MDGEGWEEDEFYQQDQKKSKRIHYGSEDSPHETDKGTKKRKISINAHVHSEMQKQKLHRAKQDREVRRSRLEAHHYYMMDLVGAHIDMKTKDVEEFILDSQDNLDEIDSFFRKHGRKSLLFFYQDADPPGLGL